MSHGLSYQILCHLVCDGPFSNQYATERKINPIPRTSTANAELDISTPSPGRKESCVSSKIGNAASPDQLTRADEFSSDVFFTDHLNTTCVYFELPIVLKQNDSP